MGKIPILDQLRTCSERAKNFTGKLVGEVTQAVFDAIQELENKTYKHGDVVSIKDGGTGASTPENARTALGAASSNHNHSVLTPTQLTTEDLDTVLTIGDYYAAGNNTCLHKPDTVPTDTSFGLKVIKVAQSNIVQIFIISSGTVSRNNDVYIRTRASGSWNGWARFYNSDHLPDLLNNATVTGTLILSNTKNANLNYNSPALVIGGTPEQKHIEIDNDEIKAVIGNSDRKSEASQLSINPNGGDVLINGKLAYKKGDLIPVSDGGTGVTSIAALKEAMVIADSGWKALSLASGIVHYSDSGTNTRVPSYRKIGNRAYIEGCIQVTPGSGSNVSIATLPDGYRPKNTIHFFTQLAGRRIGRICVAPTGSMQLEWAVDISSGEYYTTSTWMNINIDYFVD